MRRHALVLIAAGGVGLAVLVKRWRGGKDDDDKGGGGASGGGSDGKGSASKDDKPAGRDEYDARLDEELKDLDG